MSYLLECHPWVDFQVGVQFFVEDSIFNSFYCGGITIEESTHEVIHPVMNHGPPTGFSIQKWRDAKPSDPIDNLKT